VKAFARSDKERRQRELRDKEAVVAAKEKQAELSAARERSRVDIVQAAAGDLSKDEEEALKSSLQATKARNVTLVEETAAERRKLEVRAARGAGLLGRRGRRGGRRAPRGIDTVT
jgi:hypothetical protein